MDCSHIIVSLVCHMKNSFRAESTGLPSDPRSFETSGDLPDLPISVFPFGKIGVPKPILNSWTVNIYRSSLTVSGFPGPLNEQQVSLLLRTDGDAWRFGEEDS